LISGNPELGLRSFLFREEHDGQTPRPASYSKVRAGYFNRLLGQSALQFQRQLGLSRYETAFQILHKLRAGMVRPERDCIGGEYPVDVQQGDAIEPNRFCRKKILRRRYSFGSVMTITVPRPILDLMRMSP
jgi:hypothetical protein